MERNNLLFISLSTTCTARSLQGEDETKNKPPMTDVAHILSCTMGRCSDSAMVKAACKNIESGNYNGVLRKGNSLCKNILPLTNHPGITCIKVGKPPGHNSTCYTSLPDCVLSLFYTWIIFTLQDPRWMLHKWATRPRCSFHRIWIHITGSRSKGALN